VNYWVMQVIRGQYISHGPYRSEDARDNRFDKIKGGEVYKFNSFKSSAQEVTQEFKEEQLR